MVCVRRWNCYKNEEKKRERFGLYRFVLNEVYGFILNTGSITGVEGSKGGLDYATAKAGIMYGLRKSIAQYGAKYNTRCVCVSPGLVLMRTAMADKSTTSTVLDHSYSQGVVLCSYNIVKVSEVTLS